MEFQCSAWIVQNEHGPVSREQVAQAEAAGQSLEQVKCDEPAANFLTGDMSPMLLIPLCERCTRAQRNVATWTLHIQGYDKLLEP
jgi:hypothetical protein